VVENDIVRLKNRPDAITLEYAEGTEAMWSSTDDKVGSQIIVNVSESFWAYTDALKPLDDRDTFQKAVFQKASAFQADFLRKRASTGGFKPLDGQDAFQIATARKELFFLQHTTFTTICHTREDIAVASDRYLELETLLESPPFQNSFCLQISDHDRYQAATWIAVASFYAKAVEQWIATGRRRGTMLLSHIDLPRYRHDPALNSRRAYSFRPLPIRWEDWDEIGRPGMVTLLWALSRKDNISADLVSDPVFVVKLWRRTQPSYRKYGNDL
jgi:hypothetical protein